VCSGLAALPAHPPRHVLDHLLTNTRRNRPSALKHASPGRLAALLTSLRRLRHTPDFGFLHSFAQGVRFHLSSIQPQVTVQVHICMQDVSVSGSGRTAAGDCIGSCVKGVRPYGFL
jgi:hypothetical protein